MFSSFIQHEFKASAAKEMRTANFCVIAELDMVIFTAILCLLIGSIFKGCRETSVRNYRPMQMGPIGCSETSVRNYCYT